MTESTTSEKPLTNALWKTFLTRAWNRRCPRCGKGALFVARTKLAEKCDSCSLIYRREQGAMTGQLYLAAVITQIFAAIVIGIIFIFTDWSPMVSIPIGLTLLAAFGYWVFPKTIALWVCVEFMTDVGNRESWVQDNSGESDS